MSRLLNLCAALFATGAAGSILHRVVRERPFHVASHRQRDRILTEISCMDIDEYNEPNHLDRIEQMERHRTFTYMNGYPQVFTWWGMNRVVLDESDYDKVVRFYHDKVLP